MTRARKDLIHLDTTPYYHCVSRCVRRAFLCGYDNFMQKSFDHRKQWLVSRFAELTEIFAIDICAYAVMSNHYHLVLRVDAARAASWSAEEVASRWSRLYNHVTAKKCANGESMDREETALLDTAIPIWRERLKDISWFMRNINEPLARSANAEDECKGRFWEGRFKSQALIDDAALITCLAYVDLNPIRAGIANTLQKSPFTSIQQRLHVVHQKSTITHHGQRNGATSGAAAVPKLAAFADGRPPPRTSTESALPIDFASYLALVDWTGRAIRCDKQGSIPDDVAPILTQLGIDKKHWITGLGQFNRRFYSVAGRIETLRRWCERLQQSWLKSFSFSRQLFQ
jgi:REP element-mobilizing transposase RayT